jgi:excisionase family DNA binding protein
MKEKTWLTCREIAEMLNYSQRHILNLIKKGKISAEQDESGVYYVDKSEFFRAYPDAMRMEMDRTDAKSSRNISIKSLEQKISHLQEMLEEKKKQNAFLTEQLSTCTQEKYKMLDAINSHARLLEFKETSPQKPPASSNEKKGLNWWPFKKW